MSYFKLDAAEFDRLTERIKEYQGDAENAINEVLWGEGAQLISAAIMELLPRSGRTWQGKKRAAKDAAPFSQENDNLSVIVRSKHGYNYLYFPDDGSNTKKHEGNQHFMFRGAENEQERIIDLCIAKLTNEF